MTGRTPSLSPPVMPPCAHIAEDGEDLEDPAHARVSGPAVGSGRQAEPRDLPRASMMPAMSQAGLAGYRQVQPPSGAWLSSRRRTLSSRPRPMLSSVIRPLAKLTRPGEPGVLVLTCGSGEVAGSDRASSPPCLRGRPMVPGWRGGAGSCITRSLRSWPSSSTGRSASSQACRVTSWPTSNTTRIRRSPSCQCPASISRATISRIWTAVTSVWSSSGPSPRASSTAVQEVRPGSSAATTEYGQPGIICACPFPRPYTWQNSRSGLVTAPGRSQLLTSAASTSRPSAARGKPSPASDRRSRPISIRP